MRAPSVFSVSQILAWGITAVTLIAHSTQADLAHGEPKVQRSNEMEFDARVIRGQRAEGAVYLFQRSPRPLPPLLKYRRNYLKAIVTPVFSPDTRLGRQALKLANRSGVVVGASAASAQAKQGGTRGGARGATQGTTPSVAHPAKTPKTTQTRRADRRARRGVGR